MIYYDNIMLFSAWYINSIKDVLRHRFVHLSLLSTAQVPDVDQRRPRRGTRTYEVAKAYFGCDEDFGDPHRQLLIPNRDSPGPC